MKNVAHTLTANIYPVFCAAVVGLLLLFGEPGDAGAEPSILARVLQLKCPQVKDDGVGTYGQTITVCEAEPNPGAPTSGEVRAIGMDYEKEVPLATSDCTGGRGVPPCTPPDATCVKQVEFLNEVWTTDSAGTPATGKSKSECLSAGAKFINGGELLDPGQASDDVTYTMTSITWKFTAQARRRCNCPNT